MTACFKDLWFHHGSLISQPHGRLERYIKREDVLDEAGRRIHCRSDLCSNRFIAISCTYQHSKSSAQMQLATYCLMKSQKMKQKHIINPFMVWLKEHAFEYNPHISKIYLKDDKTHRFLPFQSHIFRAMFYMAARQRPILIQSTDSDLLEKLQAYDRTVFLGCKTWWTKDPEFWWDFTFLTIFLVLILNSKHESKSTTWIMHSI